MKYIPLFLLFSFISINTQAQFSSPNLINTITLFTNSLSCFDIDNDGKNDILTYDMNFPNAKITWYKNLGNGLFSNPILIEYINYGKSATASDVDADGLLDIIISSNGVTSPGINCHIRSRIQAP